MKLLAIILGVLIGTHSFAVAQSNANSSDIAGQALGAGAASSTSGMQGATGTNVGGSINSAQGVGSTAGTSMDGPNNRTVHDNKPKDTKQ
jgi:hypothetical protein